MKPTMHLVIAQGVLMQWWEDKNGGEWREVAVSKFAYPDPPDIGQFKNG